MTPTTPPKTLRVQIVDRSHPHFPEHGELTGKVIHPFWGKMAEMKLDHCRHGTDACFVSPGQVVEELAMKPQKRKRR